MENTCRSKEPACVGTEEPACVGTEEPACVGTEDANRTSDHETQPTGTLDTSPSYQFVLLSEGNDHVTTTKTDPTSGDPDHVVSTMPHENLPSSIGQPSSCDAVEQVVNETNHQSSVEEQATLHSCQSQCTLEQVENQNFLVSSVVYQHCESSGTTEQLADQGNHPAAGQEQWHQPKSIQEQQAFQSHQTQAPQGPEPWQQIQQSPATEKQVICPSHQSPVVKKQSAYQSHQSPAAQEHSAYQCHQPPDAQEHTAYQNHQSPAVQKQPTYQNHQPPAAQEHSAYQSHQSPAVQEQSVYQSHQLSAAQENLAYQSHQSPSVQEHTAYQSHQSPAVQDKSAYQSHQSPAVQEQSVYQSHQLSAAQENLAHQSHQSPSVQEHTAYQSHQSPAVQEKSAYQSHRPPAAQEQSMYPNQFQTYPTGCQKDHITGIKESLYEVCQSQAMQHTEYQDHFPPAAIQQLVCQSQQSLPLDDQPCLDEKSSALVCHQQQLTASPEQSASESNSPSGMDNSPQLSANEDNSGFSPNVSGESIEAPVNQPLEACDGHQYVTVSDQPEQQHQLLTKIDPAAYVNQHQFATINEESKQHCQQSSAVNRESSPGEKCATSFESNKHSTNKMGSMYFADPRSQGNIYQNVQQPQGVHMFSTQTALKGGEAASYLTNESMQLRVDTIPSHYPGVNQVLNTPTVGNIQVNQSQPAVNSQTSNRCQWNFNQNNVPGTASIVQQTLPFQPSGGNFLGPQLPTQGMSFLSDFYSDLALPTHNLQSTQGQLKGFNSGNICHGNPVSLGSSAIWNTSQPSQQSGPTQLLQEPSGYLNPYPAMLQSYPKYMNMLQEARYGVPSLPSQNELFGSQKSTLNYAQEACRDQLLPNTLYGNSSHFLKCSSNTSMFPNTNCGYSSYNQARSYPNQWTPNMGYTYPAHNFNSYLYCPKYVNSNPRLGNLCDMGVGQGHSSIYQGSSSAIPGYSSTYPGSSSANSEHSSTYQGSSSAIPGYSSTYQGSSSAIPEHSSTYQGSSSANSEHSSTYQGSSSANSEHSSTYQGSSSANSKHSSTYRGSSSANSEHSSTYQGSSSAIPEHSSTYQGSSSAIPEHSSTYPGSSSAIPEHSSTYPGSSSAIPEHSSTYPGSSSAIPEHSSTYQGSSSAIPEHSSTYQGSSRANPRNSFVIEPPTTCTGQFIETANVNPVPCSLTQMPSYMLPVYSSASSNKPPLCGARSSEKFSSACAPQNNTPDMFCNRDSTIEQVEVSSEFDSDLSESESESDNEMNVEQSTSNNRNPENDFGSQKNLCETDRLLSHDKQEEKEIDESPPALASSLSETEKVSDLQAQRSTELTDLNTGISPLISRPKQGLSPTSSAVSVTDSCKIKTNGSEKQQTGVVSSATATPLAKQTVQPAYHSCSDIYNQNISEQAGSSKTDMPVDFRKYGGGRARFKTVNGNLYSSSSDPCLYITLSEDKHRSVTEVEDAFSVGDEGSHVEGDDDRMTTEDEEMFVIPNTPRSLDGDEDGGSDVVCKEPGDAKHLVENLSSCTTFNTDQLAVSTISNTDTMDTSAANIGANPCKMLSGSLAGDGCGIEPTVPTIMEVNKEQLESDRCKPADPTLNTSCSGGYSEACAMSVNSDADADADAEVRNTLQLGQSVDDVLADISLTNLSCSTPEDDFRGISPYFMCLSHLSPGTAYGKENVLGVPRLSIRQSQSSRSSLNTPIPFLSSEEDNSNQSTLSSSCLFSNQDHNQSTQCSTQYLELSSMQNSGDCLKKGSKRKAEESVSQSALEIGSGGDGRSKTGHLQSQVDYDFVNQFYQSIGKPPDVSTWTAVNTQNNLMFPANPAKNHFTFQPIVTTVGTLQTDRSYKGMQAPHQTSMEVKETAVEKDITELYSSSPVPQLRYPQTSALRSLQHTNQDWNRINEQSFWQNPSTLYNVFQCQTSTSNSLPEVTSAKPTCAVQPFPQVSQEVPSTRCINTSVTTAFSTVPSCYTSSAFCQPSTMSTSKFQKHSSGIPGSSGVPLNERFGLSHPNPQNHLPLRWSHIPDPASSSQMEVQQTMPSVQDVIPPKIMRFTPITPIIPTPIRGQQQKRLSSERSKISSNPTDREPFSSTSSHTIRTGQVDCHPGLLPKTGVFFEPKKQTGELEIDPDTIIPMKARNTQIFCRVNDLSKKSLRLMISEAENSQAKKSGPSKTQNSFVEMEGRVHKVPLEFARKLAEQRKTKSPISALCAVLDLSKKKERPILPYVAQPGVPVTSLFNQTGPTFKQSSNGWVPYVLDSVPKVPVPRLAKHPGPREIQRPYPAQANRTNSNGESSLTFASLLPKTPVGCAQGVRMQRASLQNIRKQSVNLQGTNVQNIGLQNTNLQSASLQGANLQSVAFKNVKVQSTIFQNGGFQNVPNMGAPLQTASFQTNCLPNANLLDCNQQRASLRGASLQSIGLQNASFPLTNTLYSQLATAGSSNSMYTYMPRVPTPSPFQLPLQVPSQNPLTQQAQQNALYLGLSAANSQTNVHMMGPYLYPTATRDTVPQTSQTSTPIQADKDSDTESVSSTATSHDNGTHVASSSGCNYPQSPLPLMENTGEHSGKQSMFHPQLEKDPPCCQEIDPAAGKRKQSFKARHYNFCILTIGKFQYNSVLLNYDRTARIKFIFSKKKLVYEFQLNDLKEVSTNDCKRMTEIEVPFATISGIWLFDKEMRIEVSSTPKMYLGTRDFDKQVKFGMHLATNYNREKGVDLTGGQLELSPFHHIQFKSTCAEKIRRELRQFDNRFTLLLQKVFCYDPDKVFQSKYPRPIVSSLLDPHYQHKSSTAITSHMVTRSLAAKQKTHVIDVDIEETAGCSCTSGCISMDCSCIQDKGTCTSSCSCRHCQNPLNVIQNFGVPVHLAKEDPCLMENIYQIKKLSGYLTVPLLLACCQREVHVRDCIPGRISCPNQCEAQYQYSWCSATLCHESLSPRNHCLKCQRCTGFSYTHCETCNQCYFAGEHGTFKCPECRHGYRTASPDSDEISSDTEL